MSALSCHRSTFNRFEMKFCLLLSAVLATAFAVSYEDILLQEFNLYKAQYKKSYETPLEDFQRMETYLQTKYDVEQHNLKYKLGEESYEMEINEFADWLPEEIEMLNGFNKDLRDRAKAGENVVFPEPEGELYEAPNTTAPDNVNWVEKGVLAPVQHQGTCGSCYAFSALGALESQKYMKTKQMVKLSEQQIVDCSGKYGNQGCNGGSACRTYNYIRDNGGVNKASTYPYEGKVGKCRYNPQNNAATCTGFVKVSNNEEALKNAVASAGPISICVNALDSFVKYKGGIYYEPKCRNDIRSLNHAVILAGYGVDPNTKQPYWLIKNSWGTGWGEKGYMKMARNKNNMCGVASYALYPRI